MSGALGQPERREINRFGEAELQYRPLVVRLHRELGVVEITARPDEVVLNRERLRRELLPDYLRRQDPDAVQSSGFVVSRRFGMAADTDTENDDWISVFARGRWDFVFD